MTALIAEFFLAREPGARILYDLRSSRIVADNDSPLNQKNEEVLGMILGGDPSMHLNTD